MERRRSPRIAVSNHPMLPPGIVDVSLGGLSLALPGVLSQGTVHDVGVTLGNGTEVTVRVRVAYSRRESQPAGGHVFVTGCEFLADVTNESCGRTLRFAS
jgi:hypothetical protein